MLLFMLNYLTQSINSMKKGIFILATLLSWGISQAQTQLGSSIIGEDAFNWLGFSVSISADGRSFASGAQYNSNIGNNAGAVKVMHWDSVSSDWVQKGTVLYADTIEERFGFSVSISANGNILAISAPYYNGNSGRVKVYEWNGSAWAQKGAVILSEAANDMFGHALSISADGNILAVGARFNNGGGTESGHVRVFEWVGNTWSQKGSDIDGLAFEQSGYAMSLSKDGNTVVIGSPFNSGGGAFRGQVRVFTWQSATSSWTQKGQGLNGDADQEQSGKAVSINEDGTVLAIGSDYNSQFYAYNGQTKVFDWDSDSSKWVQKGTSLFGSAANQFFGRSISLNNDGNRLAVGAHGVNSDAGQVQLFEWNGISWNLVGNQLNGQAASDYFGISVSLNENGRILAAGAYGNDAGGNDAGEVKVFLFDPVTALLQDKELNAFSIFPNPFTGQLFISCNQNTDLEIYNSTGQLIYRTIVNDNLQLDGSQWPAGLYIAKIQGKSVKIIKY
jgi:hypothetical protein